MRFMPFGGYLILREMGEIPNTDTSGVKFTGGRVKDYAFTLGEMGQHEYNVQFEKCPIYGHDSYDSITTEAVNISFTGPQGYSLSRIGNSHAVYTEVLKSIKAYLEQFKPEGLVFSGADKSMDLIYDTFVRKFLSDRPGKDPHQVFLRITQDSYLRKDIHDNLQEPFKGEVEQMKARWATEQDTYFDSRRQAKSEEREFNRLSASLIGKYLTMDDTLFYVFGKLGKSLECMVATTYGAPRTMMIDANRVLKLHGQGQVVNLSEIQRDRTLLSLFQSMQKSLATDPFTKRSLGRAYGPDPVKEFGATAHTMRANQAPNLGAIGGTRPF